MTRMVHCKKLDKELEGLEKPPFPGSLGEKIYENVSKEAWDNWFTLQSQLINEYHMDMHLTESREFMLKNMENYFFKSANKDTDEKA